MKDYFDEAAKEENFQSFDDFLTQENKDPDTLNKILTKAERFQQESYLKKKKELEEKRKELERNIEKLNHPTIFEWFCIFVIVLSVTAFIFFIFYLHF